MPSLPIKYLRNIKLGGLRPMEDQLLHLSYINAHCADMSTSSCLEPICLARGVFIYFILLNQNVMHCVPLPPYWFIAASYSPNHSLSLILWKYCHQSCADADLLYSNKITTLLCFYYENNLHQEYVPLDSYWRQPFWKMAATTRCSTGSWADN